MSFYPHTRQLGAQPGIQQNPLRDNTDGFVPDQTDQVGAIVGRFKRGRIDAPFRVNRGNIRTKLGSPEAIRVSALNEAYVHAYETVNNGTQELVVSRLTTSAAVNNYAIFNIDSGGVSAFTQNAAAPSASYLFYLQMLTCFNDGYRFEVNAEKVVDGTGTPLPSKIITIRIREPNSNLLHEFKGSLDPLAVDEYGKDYFIGSVIASQTDVVTIGVFATAQVAVIADCYGRNTNGTDKLATSGANPLVLFTEGGAGYVTADYDRVIAALENASHDFGYLMSAGSQATALLSLQAQLSIRANRQFIIDVPGNLSPAAAITFLAQLSLDSQYHQAYWSPLQSDDPLNGGKAVIGTSGFQVGRRCARNAQTNAYGLAPKNTPIAGKDWPLNRTGIKQLYFPSEFELSDLANAKINPVIFERYTSGGRYVFTDSITTAKVMSSYRKLITVAEMSSTLDDMVAKYGKEVLQMPMDLAIKRMTEFLKFTLDAARSSGWLVASNDEALGDKGYAFTVTRNSIRPADRMDVNYWTHYDGVVRAIYTTQTLSR